MKWLDKAVKCAVTIRFSLAITKLDQDSLRLVGFSDAALAKNDHSTSQLGHICFLNDPHGKIVRMSFKFNKQYCITSCVMADEIT